MRLAVAKVGEMEKSPPHLVAQVIDQVLGGRSQGLIGSPQWWRQRIARLLPGTVLFPGDQQHGVRGDDQRGRGVDRVWMAHLLFAQPQRRFLVAEVHLDVPAPDIGLDDLFHGRLRIGADDVGGFSIKDFGILIQAISQRRDHDQAQIVFFSGRAPTQRRNGFDAETMAFAGGEGANGLPGDRFIFPQLFGRRRGRAINPSPSLARLLVGELVKFGVGADPSDERDAFGDGFEHRLIGVAAIEGDPQRQVVLSVRVDVSAQFCDPPTGDVSQTPLLGRLAILAPGLLAGVFAWFGRCGRMDEIDRDHARLTVLSRQGHGDLHETLGADEIGMEGRSEGIARVLGAGNAQAGLFDARVIDGGDAGGARGDEPSANGGEKVLGIEALVAVETILGGPIAELSGGGCDLSGHGMSPQANEIGEDVPSDALGDAGLERGDAFVDKALDAVGYLPGVFLP